MNKIGAGDAHTRAPAITGAGVKVAVIDTGVNCGHPDLAGHCFNGYDFVNNDGIAMDDQGHGTHVAGTIAATRNGEASTVVGVAPGADIYAVKVLDQNGSGFYSDIIAGVEWATQNGMQVTNNSYGGSSGSATLEAAFRAAAAAGVVSVAAAGNSGTQAGTGDNVGYPGKYSSVIAVAATDINDARASFSSTGPAVQIAAPGVNIKSTIMNGGYQGGWNGTSMATPHVAGVAALLVEKGVVDSNVNGETNDEIRNVLMLSALDLGAAGRDTKFGFGRVRVTNALDYPQIPWNAGITSIAYAAQPGKNRDMTITISAVYLPVVPLVGGQMNVTVKNGTTTVANPTVTTNADGVATISIPNAPSGTYTTTVNYFTNSGLGFVGGTPANSFVKK